MRGDFWISVLGSSAGCISGGTGGFGLLLKLPPNFPIGVASVSTTHPNLASKVAAAELRFLYIEGMLSSTARQAVEAYGGEQRWRDATALAVVFSAHGWAFRLKLQPPDNQTPVRVEIAQPRVRYPLIGRPGWTAFLDGQSIRLEDPDNRIVEERHHPKENFRKFRRLLWWDDLDRAYFAAYALWNYLTLLLREDIEWRETAPGRLEARFPAHLPTHCERQSFHFDPATGLLQRHDYTADVFGSWARASNVVLEHDLWNGLPYVSRSLDAWQK